MQTPGREEIEEYILGTGFIKEKSAINRISLQGLEPSSFDTLNVEYIYYPQKVLNQPFGPGTKEYADDEVI